MNLPSPFDQFLFTPRLTEELGAFIKRPAALPKVVCFYGYPGIGKTSFALAFARHFGEYYSYHPMNETNIKASFMKQLNMSTAHTLVPFITSGDKKFNKVTILDEFHNLSPKSQDFFKTQFDVLGDDDRVIVCLNTTETKDVKDLVTEPIDSRMTVKIDFNVRRSEYLAHAKNIAYRYPHLKLHEIKSLLPDMRQISNQNDMRKALTA